MKIILILLFFSIKITAAVQEWNPFEHEGQIIYSATTATSLSINPHLFGGTRNYLVQSHECMGAVPAFEIRFQNESIRIFRLQIPNIDPEGFGLTNIYLKNQENSGHFSDVATLMPKSDNWVRSVVELRGEEDTKYFGKNYQITDEKKEYTCSGVELCNTVFCGIFPLIFKSPKTTRTLNPLFALMIQPFDPADSERDLSDSIFATEGGSFLSGSIDFNDSQGIQGIPKDNAFLLSCEQFILTVKGSGEA